MGFKTTDPFRKEMHQYLSKRINYDAWGGVYENTDEVIRGFDHLDICLSLSGGTLGGSK